MKNVFVFLSLLVLNNLSAHAGQQYCDNVAVSNQVRRCADGSPPLYRASEVKLVTENHPGDASVRPAPAAQSNTSESAISKGRGQAGSPIVGWVCKNVNCADAKEFPSGLWALQISGGSFTQYVGLGTMRFVLKAEDGAVLDDAHAAPAGRNGDLSKSIYVRSLKSGIYTFYYLPRNGDTVLAAGKFKVVKAEEKTDRSGKSPEPMNLIDYNDPYRVNPYIVPGQVH